jgi:hypothetical protein
MGCLAAASRMTWSFARDRGLPFSRALSMVSKQCFHKRPSPLTPGRLTNARPSPWSRS